MLVGRINLSTINAALDAPLGTINADRPVPLRPDALDTVPERPDGDEGERGNSGFIVIRLDGKALSRETDDAKTLAEMIDRLDLSDLAKLMDEYDLGPGERLVRDVSPERLREMEERARQSEFPPLRSLLSYWRLDMRGQTERMGEVLKRLGETPGVVAAYQQAEFTDPAVNPANDPYNAQQGYQDAAPDGIDARWAWTQPDGCGQGIAVIDVERGWTLSHEDFATKSPSLIAGDNRPGSADHGTAVLGEMIADDNTVGVVGIAPLAGPVNCSSYWDDVTGTSSDISNAVVAAIASLNAGDALIIEVQTIAPNPFGAPAEYVDESFDAIRLASALGIVVFEAAGNGNQNLDTITNGGLQILNPASADFRDSGAIVCGAGEDALPHDRAIWGGGQASSFGARVNCYGWGRNVVTAGYGTLDNGGGDVNAEYADTFSGTSSATPIVTGAGLIVQGMQEAATGVRLSPQQMRLLLSNPATGTAQGPNVAGNIGIMPDLRAIIETTLGLSADIYLRDNAGDDGSVPSTGGISASPDIIVRPVALADPAASFGEGSGVENSSSLGYEVEAGQDNFIYVRMKNRGMTDAPNASADVYWSEVSTLVTPDMWNLIGTTPPVTVPTGDTLEVTDALTWASADIPGEGHYCFVGILDHPADPAPPLPSPTDWNGFRAFIRNQNNVTWRNFNVIDLEPDTEPGAQNFLIANMRDRRRVFDFVIEQRLPREAQAILEVPLELLKPFCGNLDLKCEMDREKGVGRIHLPRAPRLTVPKVVLAKGARLKCRFLFEGIGKHGRPGNMISIAQHHEELEVGRVSWRFDRRPDPKELG